MKTLALSVFLLFVGNTLYSQDDSLFISVFVSPLEELIIEEQDSLVLINEALLIGGDQQDFNYTFYVAGFDTLIVNSIDIHFVCDDGEELSGSYTLAQIDSDSLIERIGNSVFLPLGIHEFHESYSFSATLKDADENILISKSETLNPEEDEN